MTKHNAVQCGHTHETPLQPYTSCSYNQKLWTPDNDLRLLTLHKTGRMQKAETLLEGMAYW